MKFLIRVAPRPWIPQERRAIMRRAATRVTTEIAPDSDVLWIDGPIELTPVSSTAIVRQRAD